jgi:hypothetical protein
MSRVQECALILTLWAVDGEVRPNLQAQPPVYGVSSTRPAKRALLSQLGATLVCRHDWQTRPPSRARRGRKRPTQESAPVCAEPSIDPKAGPPFTAETRELNGGDEATQGER